MPPKAKANPSPKSRGRPKKDSSSSSSNRINLRSNRMENSFISSPIGAARNSSSNVKPRPPTPKRPKSPKRSSGAQVFSNAPVRESKESNMMNNHPYNVKKEVKPPNKRSEMQQTMTVQDLYRAEQKFRNSKKFVMDPPPHTNWSEQPPLRHVSSFEEEAPMARRAKMHIGEGNLYSSRSNFAESIKDEVANQGRNTPKNTPRQPKPLTSPRSKPQRVMAESMSLEEVMAERLHNLSFREFKELRLGEREELIYVLWFDEIDSGRRRQVEFTVEELDFLSKALHKNFRFDFLEEYLGEHSQLL